MENDVIFDNNNRCIYCNEIIPEGRQVCYACQELMTGGRVWRADKTKGVFKKGRVYFSYNHGQCCVDLTLKYGKGNEPLSLADPRLRECVYTTHHKEVLRGKIK